MTEANYDEVICPNCVHQFRAIPVNVQDELRRLIQHEAANLEWMEKTAWLQPQPKELGMHRADVLRDRISALEAENAALREALAKPAVPASFTDEDVKASWLTGFKEAEFQFRGGTEKSGEFPAKTPLSVAPQAAPPKQPSVPPGYALVPIEPTPEMCRAYTGGAITESGFKWCRHQWAAMLAAAPQPKDKP